MCPQVLRKCYISKTKLFQIMFLIKKNPEISFSVESKLIIFIVFHNKMVEFSGFEPHCEMIVVEGEI